MHNCSAPPFYFFWHRITPPLTCIFIAIQFAFFTHSTAGVYARTIQVAARAVAITFDDLPGVSLRDFEAKRAFTVTLLHALKTHSVPAIGFVNERQLYVNDAPAESRVAVLQLWLDAGMDLGNHTFSHPDLHSMTLEEFQKDIVRGEIVTKRLLRAQGKSLRYFRHPFLHTGRDLETKRKLEASLAEREYRIAPVTIDNSEWIFAKAYENAIEREDKAMMQRIGDAYIPYMEQKFDYFERQSKAFLDYEMKQILLLHANAINAEYFNALAEMMKRRGYKFISLDEALTDKAYALPDTYTGRSGISWLHRWILSGGQKDKILRNEPTTPEFVLREAGVAEE